MINSLIQYFIQFGHLVFPGIGVIKWQKQEPYWENNKLVAPKQQIIFELMYEQPSQQFYTFLADDLGVSKEDAILQFEDFINQFTIKTIASINIGNLGTLHKNASQYSWNSLYNSVSYYRDINPKYADKKFEDGLMEQPKKIESWILWAIGFILIGISLIVYKHL
jgi:hypothetical protein